MRNLPRKSLILLLLLALIVPTSVQGYSQSGFQCADFQVGDNVMYVNGEQFELDEPPYLNNGSAMVPLNTIEDFLGALVSWNGSERTAIILFNDKRITVQPGKTTGYINGIPVSMAVAPEIRNGRIFVPLRFISESFGAHILYFPEDKSMVITYADKTDWARYTVPGSGLTMEYPPDLLVEDKDSLLCLETYSGTKIVLNPESSQPQEAALARKNELMDLKWTIKHFDPITYHKSFQGITMTADRSGLWDDLFDSYYFNAGDTGYSFEIIGSGDFETYWYDSYLAWEIFVSSTVTK